MHGVSQSGGDMHDWLVFYGTKVKSGKLQSAIPPKSLWRMCMREQKISKMSVMTPTHKSRLKKESKYFVCVCTERSQIQIYEQPSA